MREIVFAKTRWHYDSYTDFWKLVELSGFPIIYVDELDKTKDCVYIVTPMNGELNDSQLVGDKALILLWNLERPGEGGTLQRFTQDNYEMIGKQFHKIVLSDMALCADCCDISNSQNFVYVPVGLHSDLGSPGSYSAKEYDVAHLSCYSNRRSWMFKTPSIPKSNIDGISVAPNGWGLDRHNSLQASRYMLAVHQDEFKFIEPLRYVLAAAYGLPIISEECNNPFPFASDYVYSIARMKQLIESYDKRMYAIGLDFRDWMLRHFTFRSCVEKLVGDL